MCFLTVIKECDLPLWTGEDIFGLQPHSHVSETELPIEFKLKVNIKHPINASKSFVNSE